MKIPVWTIVWRGVEEKYVSDTIIRQLAFNAIGSNPSQAWSRFIHDCPKAHKEHFVARRTFIELPSTVRTCKSHS